MSGFAGQELLTTEITEKFFEKINPSYTFELPRRHQDLTDATRVKSPS